MILTIIYRLILVLVAGIVCWNLFSEKKFALQLNCALVLIPLVLRALMIK